MITDHQTVYNLCKLTLVQCGRGEVRLTISRRWFGRLMWGPCG